MSSADIITRIDRETVGNKLAKLTKFPGVRVLLSDGNHRLHALLSLVDRMEEDKKWIEADFFARRDGQKMTLGDCHRLGSLQNHLDTQGQRETAFDRIHIYLMTYSATLSMSEADVNDSPFDPEELKSVMDVGNKKNSPSLRALVTCRGLCGELSEGQQRLYCTAALGLHRFRNDKDVYLIVCEADGTYRLNCNDGSSLSIPCFAGITPATATPVDVQTE